MNYIRHLSAFYKKISIDDRLNPSHVSLYMALFQFWNLNRFENPISISRGQALKLCKIGSYHTYHKCLHDLHNYGYIIYEPSHNPLKGSLIYLCIFETSSEPALHNISDKNETSTVHALHSSLNNINIVNNKTLIDENSQTGNLKIKKCNNEVKKKIRRKIPNIPPNIKQVIEFFKNEKYSSVEAQKFFNHFQSNGWRVGGKSPMKDWKAAARNWMLNINNFIYPKNLPQQHYDVNPNDKDYSKPL